MVVKQSEDHKCIGQYALQCFSVWPITLTITTHSYYIPLYSKRWLPSRGLLQTLKVFFSITASQPSSVCEFPRPVCFFTLSSACSSHAHLERSQKHTCNSMTLEKQSKLHSFTFNLYIHIIICIAYRLYFMVIMWGFNSIGHASPPFFFEVSNLLL